MANDTVNITFYNDGITGVNMPLTINGENNKSVTIDVDEQGGVFLDPKELAELAEIKNVDVLLTDRIKGVVTQYPPSGGSGYSTYNK